MTIELVKDNEFEKVHKVIKSSVKKSFPIYYPQGSIDYVIESLSPEKLKSRAAWAHFYVVKIEGEIVGCGAIGPYWDSETESSLFNIFVSGEYQGRGIGKKLIETLENDEYGKRASRSEIPASMVAIPFYKKMGYEHKNGELNYEDGHFAMEKFTKKD